MPTHDPAKPRSVRRDLALLVLLCLPTYFFGLATHGLTNWQESIRCLVAQEMAQRGEWIVPTVGGDTYLAKPPLIYWCQLALASLTGSEPGVFHLRLTVALAASLGVVLTYLAARSLFLGPRPHDDAEAAGTARRAAWWSALFLATGILHVRSGRIGELDILLVPSVVLGVWGVWLAWRAHLEGAKRTHLPGIALAVLGATLAALAKGPPGVMVLALAAYGGIVLHACAAAREQGGTHPAWLRPVRVAVGMVAGLAIAWLTLPDARGESDTDSWIGLMLLSLGAGAIAWAFAGLIAPGAGVRTFKAMAKTHPVAVLLLPFGVVWLWGRAVAARVGQQAVDLAVRTEAGENLELLDTESPVNNLEAASFGVGLGSIACIAAIVWLLKDRPRFRPGWWIVVAWVALGFAAFCYLSKGVPRYLTPVWPGIAMLGGLWFAHLLGDLKPRTAQGVRTVAYAAVLALAIGQGVWYGYARDELQGDRSPRDLIAELLAPERGVDARTLAVYDLWSPAVDFYVGRTVERWDGIEPDADIPGGSAPPVEELLAQLRESGGSRVLLVREGPHPGGITGETGPEQLERLGFDVEFIPLESAWVIDNRRTGVAAVRVRVARD
ncbi:MAG: phospholipid carrier-dependent glycosyltransferase [Phycisphaerales bacterium]|nr:MAG: phospholipid carrier-dependent glycosyltransferase [Phycisphaerales bacterium]